MSQRTSWPWPPSLLFLIALGIVTGMMFVSAYAAPQDKDRWNRKYSAEEYILGREPISFLKENIGLLPKGTALDIAMGEGRNGVYLATQGFEVTGVDISEQGLEKARSLARQAGVHIETKVVDLEAYKLPPDSYDLIVCT